MQSYPWLQEYDQAQKHDIYYYMTKNWSQVIFILVINVKFWHIDFAKDYQKDSYNKTHLMKKKLRG